MRIKTALRFHLTPVKTAKETAGVGEDVEKEEQSSTAGVIARWCNHFGNQSGGSSEKMGTALPGYITPGHTPRGFPSMQ